MHDNRCSYEVCCIQVSRSTSTITSPGHISSSYDAPCSLGLDLLSGSSGCDSSGIADSATSQNTAAAAAHASPAHAYGGATRMGAMCMHMHVASVEDLCEAVDCEPRSQGGSATQVGEIEITPAAPVATSIVAKYATKDDAVKNVDEECSCGARTRSASLPGDCLGCLKSASVVSHGGNMHAEPFRRISEGQKDAWGWDGVWQLFRRAECVTDAYAACMEPGCADQEGGVVAPPGDGVRTIDMHANDACLATALSDDLDRLRRRPKLLKPVRAVHVLEPSTA